MYVSDTMALCLVSSSCGVGQKCQSVTAHRYIYECGSVAAPVVCANHTESTLEAYAFIVYEQPNTEWADHLHRGEHVAKTQHHLTNLIRNVLTKVAKTGTICNDIPLEELTSYCLHALTAASGLPSKAGVRRLVSVTLAGLRPRA